ncbi:MAG: hypothetical protein LBL45_05585 [Treponema sp.]|jgi:hypothetical protein|nr:hypothetical protein [Treponema sp.]
MAWRRRDENKEENGVIEYPDDLELRNAIVEYAEITNDDHGLLTAWIGLKYKGRNQGFGGHVLYIPAGCRRHKLESLARHFIWRVMEIIAGAREWSELRGRTVRARHNRAQVWEIGHVVKDDWFCPARDFAL